MKSVLIAFAAIGLLAACDQPKSAPAEVAKSQKPALNAAQIAFAAANDRMHGAMSAIPADADVAFVQGMIPHHRGAVEMAEIVLEHGKDAETEKLARKVIAAQTAEIAEMEAWLKKRGVDPSAADHAAMGH